MEVGNKPRSGTRPLGKLVIKEPQQMKSPRPSGPASVGEKRKATEEETSQKKVKTDLADDIWYPAWDIRKGDSLFAPNEGGRFVNIAPFEAFLLPRNRDCLAKADLEESFGASMGHMSRALAYFALGSSMLASSCISIARWKRQLRSQTSWRRRPLSSVI